MKLIVYFGHFNFNHIVFVTFESSTMCFCVFFLFESPLFYPFFIVSPGSPLPGAKLNKILNTSLESQRILEIYFCNAEVLTRQQRKEHL